MNLADENAANPDALGSGEKSDQQLRAILENLQRVGRQRNEEDEPMERDDLHSGFTRLDWEASERKALYDRLGAIENEMKRRGSRGFARYLVAICIGVAATVAWQSYGDAIKQIIAARAPELGWSPQAKQMIASWTLGWTKPPAGSEKQPAPVAQTEPEMVAPKAPAAPSFDPEQVQRMALDLATLRQTVDRLAVGLDEVNREIGKLEVADEEILAKLPAPPPPPPTAAPARKPAPSSRAPMVPSSRTSTPQRQ
jgi:hypothetical protein